MLLDCFDLFIYFILLFKQPANKHLHVLHPKMTTVVAYGRHSILWRLIFVINDANIFQWTAGEKIKA